ncbi:jg10680 [Pararge aegeria aegeria]|uniref:Jg10680 protein n=1 Tax=Pararge aegeria aegeria TaxID=348720 RepID=A0A8S4RWV3_9NEOP|nr:jg10680 [Pararge aegeria aegeria]
MGRERELESALRRLERRLAPVSLLNGSVCAPNAVPFAPTAETVSASAVSLPPNLSKCTVVGLENPPGNEFCPSRLLAFSPCRMLQSFVRQFKAVMNMITDCNG